MRPAVNEFVGRQSEINDISNYVNKLYRDNSKSVIICIRGIPGVGKSELAYFVANELMYLYPDVQIVIDLSGKDDNITPEEALRKAIKAFGEEEEISGDISELQSRYRDRLYGKRALLIVDDAKSRQYVEALLPPAGCALIFTTRNRFKPLDMHIVDLDVLSTSAAEELLVRICPRIHSQAKELAKLCAYLPLALRVSASLLESTRSRSVHQYCDQLRAERIKNLTDPDNEDDPRASVEASVNLSYGALKIEAKHVFSLLSIFPSSFGKDAANSVADLPNIPDDVIGVLERGNLINFFPETERYQMHDLIRDFGRLRLTKQEEILAKERYAEYYLGFAIGAVKELTGSTRRSAFERLNQEHNHFAEVIHQSIADDNLLPALQLIGNTWRYWETYSYTALWQKLFSDVLQQALPFASANTTLRIAYAKALTGVGVLELSQGRRETAKQYINQGFELLKGTDDIEGLANAIFDLGFIALRESRYIEANGLCLSSRKYYKVANNIQGLAASAMLMAQIAERQDDFDEALKYYQESEELFTQIQDMSGSVRVLTMQGDILRQQKRFDEAERILLKAEHIAAEEKLLYELSVVANNLGFVLIATNQFERAEHHFIDSLQLFETLDDGDGIAWTVQGLAQTAAKKAEWERAASLLGVTAQIRDQYEVELDEKDQAELDILIQEGKANLTPELFAETFDAGFTLPWAQAIGNLST